MTDFLSTQSTEPSSRGWVGPLSLMTLVQVAATSSTLALTALAPAVAESLGIGAHWIGYQVSLIYFAGMFASAFAGSVVEALEAERVIWTELMLFIVGLGLLATAQPLAMIAGSMCLGVGYGLNNPASSEILNRATPRHRQSFVFSFKQSGVPLGAVVANVALPSITVALGGAWQLAILLAAAPAAILLTIFLVIHEPSPRRRAAPGGAVARMVREQVALYRDARLRTLALLGGLYSALQLVVTAFTVVMLVEHGWSIVAAGSVAAALQLCGAVGRIAWGLAADRLGGFETLALIGTLSGLFLFALNWLDAYPAFIQVMLFMALGGVASGWNGVFLAAAARTAPKGKVGANTGALLVYTFIGVIIGPSVYALVYDIIGDYGLCFTLFSGIGFLGAVLSLRQRRGAASVSA